MNKCSFNFQPACTLANLPEEQATLKPVPSTSNSSFSIQSLLPGLMIDVIIALLTLSRLQDCDHLRHEEKYLNVFIYCIRVLLRKNILDMIIGNIYNTNML